MIDNGYIFARDKKRIFINTCLGCKSKCKFCYLSKMGMNKMERKTSIEVLEMLDTFNFKYDKNALITLGCFSECFDEANKKDTLEIARQLFPEIKKYKLSNICPEIGLDNFKCNSTMDYCYMTMLLFEYAKTKE